MSAPIALAWIAHGQWLAADGLPVTTAMLWMVQGTSMLAAVALSRRMFTRWQSARRHVMLFPGAAAIGAYVALEVLALAAVAFGIGALLAWFGSSTAAGLLMGGSLTAVAVAISVHGMLRPNLGVERAHASRTNA